MCVAESVCVCVTRPIFSHNVIQVETEEQRDRRTEREREKGGVYTCRKARYMYEYGGKLFTIQMID